MSIFEELNQIIKTEISKIDAVSVEEQTYKHIPVGDKIIDTFLLGGGLPLGSFITFTGHSSSFKTTMIVNIVSKILNSDPESYYLVFLDSEASMTVERIRNLGIRDNQFKIYTSLTVESVNSIVNTLSKIKREN
ncbi:MAG: hypothetical protein N3A69_17620, partial [Leptospiraceae bacterium]|nr:hypothetical protein [Leptospiraceae bacterium]